jgi:formylmethanofuran dehydrogenase subunit E
MNKSENPVRTVRILVPGNLAILPTRQVGERSLRPAPRGGVTRPRTCICCGEPMVEQGNALSRNPNVCASCSSLADGMEAENDQDVT